MKKLYFTIIGIMLLSVNSKAQTVTDIDGNMYNTVVIGTQKWLQQDLKVTHFQNGDSVPNVKDSINWRYFDTPAYCDYKNTPIIASKYGRLYNWFVAADTRKICPYGYHVSTDNDWVTLTKYLGYEYIAGGKLKEDGTTNWFSPNTGADNSSGFTALPGGMRTSYTYSFPKGVSYGVFDGKGSVGIWWTTLDIYDSFVYCRNLSYNEAQIHRYLNPKNYGLSIRCVCDTAFSQIDKNEGLEGFNISPNPFSQSTQITLNQTYQNIALAVYDIQGKQLAQQHYTHCSQLQFHRNNLTNGMYFVKLTLDDKQVETVKMVISE